MKWRIDNDEIWELVGNWATTTWDGPMRFGTKSSAWGGQHHLVLHDVAVVVRMTTDRSRANEKRRRRVERPGLQRGGVPCGPGGWCPD